MYEKYKWTNAWKIKLAERNEKKLNEIKDEKEDKIKLNEWNN